MNTLDQPDIITTEQATELADRAEKAIGALTPIELQPLWDRFVASIKSPIARDVIGRYPLEKGVGRPAFIGWYAARMDGGEL